MYVKDPGAYYFDAEAVDREPYMAPGLVTAEKAARGKLPTDVWWHTIVPPNGSEKTGYPTQKPRRRPAADRAGVVAPGDWCLDFFAGQRDARRGRARELGRRYVLVDESADAVAVMRRAARAAGVRARAGGLALRDRPADDEHGAEAPGRARA